MVDEVRVLALLRSVTDDLGALAGEATHLCYGGLGPPKDNGDSIELLGRRGVLNSDLAVRIRRAVGFRNVLVHEYIEVDDGIVIDRLHDPDDLRAFVKAVARWMSAGP